jgi:hypothetical protein
MRVGPDVRETYREDLAPLLPAIDGNPRRWEGTRQSPDDPFFRRYFMSILFPPPQSSRFQLRYHTSDYFHVEYHKGTSRTFP